MREIKFRGKRLDNGEWVEGYYTKKLCGEYIDNQFMESEKDFIVTYFSSGGITSHEVIPETVGQFTSLKDKNGMEIYEGDIVTGLFNHTDIIGHIVYGSDATFFIKRKGLYGIGLNNAEDWLEVIGNIYENQELLKE